MPISQITNYYGVLEFEHLIFIHHKDLHKIAGEEETRRIVGKLTDDSRNPEKNS